MMQQWADCKKKAGEAVLLFRMGDFYEAFYEDATLLSEVLDLTLTKRQGIPMSGVPWHHVDGYIDKLVGQGYKVAIAEQVEDPSQTKGLLQRKIMRVITPGTILPGTILAESEKRPNYIAAISQIGNSFALSFLELSTGEFKVCEFENLQELKNEIIKIHPKEIVVSKKWKEKFGRFFEETSWTLQEDYYFEYERASKILLNHFQIAHLDGFGLKGKNGAIQASGALLGYIKEELSLPVKHIHKISLFANHEFLLIDATTERHLELSSSHDKNPKSTLIHLIDKTVTPMGGRRLWEWLKKPLLSVKEIEKRQDAIEALYFSSQSSELVSLLKDVRDLERLMMKISSNFATPKDIGAFARSLENITPLKEILKNFKEKCLLELNAKLVDVTSLTSYLQSTLVEDLPLRLGEGTIFKEGVHLELDDLKCKKKNGKNWLLNYQVKLKEECGIKTLKVGYNKIFGYYIEVSRGQSKLVPESFHKKQTLVNGERYTTEALNQYESDLLTAEERILAIETETFEKLRLHIATFATDIFQIALSIGTLDALLSLAKVAKEKNFVRPLIDESQILEIIEGRHPVVEDALLQNQFIPNDTLLDKENSLMLITGPNMAGKSTFIRQVALIIILGQMGSFVPASRAHFGAFDKIFTRIGASDDLSRGQSTFMVEMSETANILNNVTPKSLVILDEIGRGTSTYDGVAIAWAVLEHLLVKEKKAKTLFATHYFELTHLEKKISGIINYHADVEETKEGIVFLHKIAKGIAKRSYGIHVAKLAGLPLPVIVRAQQILSRLEKTKDQREEKKGEQQLLLFT